MNRFQATIQKNLLPVLMGADPEDPDDSSSSSNSSSKEASESSKDTNHWTFSYPPEEPEQKQRSGRQIKAKTRQPIRNIRYLFHLKIPIIMWVAMMMLLMLPQLVQKAQLLPNRRNIRRK